MAVERFPTDLEPGYPASLSSVMRSLSTSGQVDVVCYGFKDNIPHLGGIISERYSSNLISVSFKSKLPTTSLQAIFKSSRLILEEIIIQAP